MAGYLPKDRTIASVTLSEEVEMDAVPEQNSTMRGQEMSSPAKTDDDNFLSDNHKSDSVSTSSVSTNHVELTTFRPIIICDEEDQDAAEQFRECLNDIHVANGQVKAEVFDALPGELHFQALGLALQSSTHTFILLTPSFCRKETLKNVFQSHLCLHNTLDSQEWNLIPVHTERENCRQYQVPTFLQGDNLAPVFYSIEEHKIDQKDVSRLEKKFNKKQSLQDTEQRKQAVVRSRKMTEFQAERGGRDIPGDRSTVFWVNSDDTAMFSSKLGHQNTVKEAIAIGLMAKRICLICGPDGDGTGFRVGSVYVLTAAHVVESLGSNNGTITNYTAYFNCVEDCDKTKEEKKYLFKRKVYFSLDLDAAILELEANKALPPCFEHFSPPAYYRNFYLVGHHETAMMYDLVKKRVPLNAKNMKCLESLDRKSYKMFELRYDNTDNLSSVSDRNRALFLCRFRIGASGSPGVWIEGNNYVVATMLQGGFPRWYYGGQILKWLPAECVEQGLSMKALYHHLHSADIQLCKDIFRNTKYMDVDFPPSASFTTRANNWVYRCNIL